MAQESDILNTEFREKKGDPRGLKSSRRATISQSPREECEKKVGGGGANTRISSQRTSPHGGWDNLHNLGKRFSSYSRQRSNQTTGGGKKKVSSRANSRIEDRTKRDSFFQRKRSGTADRMGDGTDARVQVDQKLREIQVLKNFKGSPPRHRTACGRKSVKKGQT